MPLRGAAQRDAIRRVVEVFGANARDLVFLGGCALALYARPRGPALRATKDVDCVSTKVPWVLQEAVLAELCRDGALTPDADIQCRYHLRGTDRMVDVLSPEGMNVGGGSETIARAARAAIEFELGGGVRVRAIPPEHFLLTKLDALLDRGPDVQSSADAEDIVTAVVEVSDVPARVRSAGLDTFFAQAGARLTGRYGIGHEEVADLVTWHLHRDDQDEEQRVVRDLRAILFPAFAS
jgi:predicted nucleotidyltransferase